MEDSDLVQWKAQDFRMATKGLVLTTAERPVFVRSSPVHQSLQITKDVATQPPVCAPTRALRKVEASPTGTELGEQQTGTYRLTRSRAYKREVMLNKPD
eukprot:bmy_07235T0